MARLQISPLAGGVTREIASSPPSSSPPSGDTVQKCTPTAHELRETSGSHAIRESSLREGKDRSRHTLSLSLRERDLDAPSSEIRGFSRYCWPLFDVNPDYYMRLRLCYPHVPGRGERFLVGWLAISKGGEIVGALEQLK